MDTDSIAQHSTKGISGVINRLKLKIYSLTGRFGLLPQIPFLIVLILLCAGFTLAPTEQAKAAGISYTASQIGTLPVGSTRIVRAANDSGEIVGTAKDSRSGPKGFFWDASGRHTIVGSEASGDYSSANDINDKGEVVGSMNVFTGIRAFRSQRKDKLVFLDQLPGDTSSVALAIGLSGKATGWSSGSTRVRAAIWSPVGAVQALPMLPDSESCRGLAINNHGDVAGVCDTSAGPRAVLWAGGSDKTAQDLGMLSGDYGSEASGINDSGDIVGTSMDRAKGQRAVLWPKGSVIKDLGTLPDRLSSRALAINNRGEVIGVSEGNGEEQAFLWTNEEGMQDLNNLLSSVSDFKLTHAISISSGGSITAIGHDKITLPGDHSHDIHDLPLRIFRLNPVGAR